MVQLTQPLEGIHHITAITADAPANVHFYAEVLGLRMVKKTVNFDAPDVYHLYYADEQGHPGTVLTFFEFPGAAQGRHGDGMIHTIQWAVAGPDSLDFWESRLDERGVELSRRDGVLSFTDPEGLGIELVVLDAAGGLQAEWPEIPPEHALRGFAGVRVYTSDPGRSHDALAGVLGFEPQAQGSAYTTTGPAGHPILYTYDEAPGRGYQGAGTVHHIAWAVEPDEQAEWRMHVAQAELRPTPIIDRQYFRSVYFREPSGVLFELATKGPGFDIDEPGDQLGEQLMLPPQYESMRADLEQRLTPLQNPRSSRSGQ